MKQEGRSQAEIAGEIGFSQSTVSRELQRNSGTRSYSAAGAQKQADQRKGQKGVRSRAIDDSNRKEIERRLREKHSPEQVSGALRKAGLKAPSHQVIYEHVYQDKQAKGDLWKHLRINNRRRYVRRAGRKRDKIPNRTDISERPAVVEERSRHGDWEADLICGCAQGGFLLTLVERRSRYGCIVRIEDKKALTTGAGILCALHKMGVHTITYDNGPEFSMHELVSEELSCQAFFCKPYASWEKGAVENFNGLVRQYFPAGTDFNQVSDRRVREVQNELNNRPRKILAFDAPIAFLSKLIA